MKLTAKQLAQQAKAWQQEALRLRELNKRLRDRPDASVDVRGTTDGGTEIVIRLAPRPQRKG